MKKKNGKILCAILVVFLCTGCKINYNLEIKDLEVVEEIIVNDDIMSGRDSNAILNTYNTWMPVYDNILDDDLSQDSEDGQIDGIEYHEKTINRTSDGYRHTYKYTYPIDEFNHANSLRLAFGSPSFYDGGNYINLRTNNENALCNYDYFEALQVNIKVDLNTYKVEKSNAHRVNGNIYTWNLNQDNCSNSIISMTLTKLNKTVSTTTTKKGSQVIKKINNGLNNYVLYIFLVIVVLIIIYGYRWFNQMKERDNRVD